MTLIDPQRVESLGPAERILATLLTWSDHIVHNRPGVVCADATSVSGVRWAPATWRQEGEHKVVYRLDRQGGKTVEVRLGLLEERDVVRNGEREVGTYRRPGLFPEAAVWLYRQVAEVWSLDNDFAARWASWAFPQEHRDLKVALAAFMLVQSRSGQPVREGDAVLFCDDDHRAVGEAMCLLRRRDGRDLHPKLLLRVGELLKLDGVARINRELGFGRSARNPPLGRYPRVVDKWLRHRERNLPMLQGLVRAGYRHTVMRLARSVGYKPETPRFFEVLRWKQKQAADGRRELAIGVEVAAAETWDGMSEAEVCALIVATSPSYKRIVGLLPAEVGLTRAVLAASIEAGSLSDTDLILLSPTLEDLGLLDIPEIGDRWMAASEAVEDQRAAHIAERVRGRETAEKLQAAADRSVQKAVQSAARGLRVYVAVDISASMGVALDKARGYLTRFLQGFALDKLTVAVFNTSAREVTIRHPSAAGVEHAFRGFKAGGGTHHASAIRDVFAHNPPAEDEDALFLFVGDQQELGTFADPVRDAGLRPMAFGFLHVPGSMGDRYKAVEQTAQELEIPCFAIDEDMFGDVYAVPRTLRHLVASTPVGRRSPAERSLLQEILQTPLLAKPAWA